jgi:hypothetical protein
VNRVCPVRQDRRVFKVNPVRKVSRVFKAYRVCRAIAVLTV